MEKEKRVPVRLRRGRENEENEVFVGLNGEFYRIRRGETVEVPAGVAEILHHAEVYEDAFDAYLRENKGTGCPA